MLRSKFAKFVVVIKCTNEFLLVVLHFLTIVHIVVMFDLHI